MDFKDQIRQLSARIPKIKDSILTEEATKNAFVMPFIQTLGYDVFDPSEVVPELDCDLVKKKGEKIDYAIRKDGETIMLIECKHCGQNLNLHESQLQRYFAASKAKFGVLTNGVEYRFYTDLAKTNLMDTSPFLVVDMEDIKDGQIEELKKFHKSYFDIDTIVSTASELKYMSELKSVIKEEFFSPSEEFVRLLARRVYDGTVTQKVIAQFTDFVRKSLATYVNDIISERLDRASSLSEERQEQTGQAEEHEQAEEEQQTKIVTTEEELEGFYIVKSILHDVIAPERISYRDRQDYFNILVDDNIKKLICRLYFNRSNKKKIVISCDGGDEKYDLPTVDSIYGFADRLTNAALKYSNQPQ